MNRQSSPDVPAITPTAQELEVLRQLRSLRFGTVEIQVHDGRIVQIERRERRRFDRPDDQS